MAVLKDDSNNCKILSFKSFLIYYFFQIYFLPVSNASPFLIQGLYFSESFNNSILCTLTDLANQIPPVIQAPVICHSRDYLLFKDRIKREENVGQFHSTSRVLTLQLLSISNSMYYSSNGMVSVLHGTEISLLVIGVDLSNSSEIQFTTHESDFGTPCLSHDRQLQTSSYSLNVLSSHRGSVLIGGLPMVDQNDVFYLCLKSGDDFIHQGKDLFVIVFSPFLPTWLLIIFIVILLCLSALFSGLTLGLMALDQTELKIVQNTGSPQERNYANKIAPIRSHGNFLLCSLLLGNVLVNNSLTLLLDTLTSGIVAVICATIGIVVFGEIIPQAFCSRHGLAVGAYTIWLTKFFMLLTFPLSFPISKILDLALGTEIGTVYNKERLIELIRVTNENNDLEKDEVNIVTGALKYKQKTVRDIMTQLEDCFILPLSSFLTFETISRIREEGYSRIPIYDGPRNNIVHVLFAKDLMFVDPDDNMPIHTVCDFYNNDVNFVFHDTPLNVMFNEFKSGDKGHMAFVQDINTEGEGDPSYETCGLVTLEDIIEEIIQQEIMDETDVFTDNRSKKRRSPRHGRKGKEISFPAMKDSRLLSVSPQLTMAILQYLITSVEPFKEKILAESILKKLLLLDVIREIKVKGGNSSLTEENSVIISRGKPIDFFILILEGRVEVNIGKEEIVFEGGPFRYFGVQALLEGDVEEQPCSPTISSAEIPTALRNPSIRRNPSLNFPISTTPDFKRASIPTTLDFSVIKTPLFVPDYSVKATTDVLYLKIPRHTYQGAVKASLLYKIQSASGEINESELDFLLGVKCPIESPSSSVKQSL